MGSETASFVKSQVGSGQSQAMVDNACKRLIINLMVSKPHLRSLLVTGCSPGSGSTVVVAFVARYLASAMKRVLLIDANFDQPGLPAIFPPKGSISTSGDLIPQATDNAKIDLIAVAQFAAATGRAFNTPAFGAALAKLTSEYDLVLIDSASATVCPDTLALSTQIEGVLVVIQAEKTRQQVAQKVCEDLKAVGAHVLGAVLNRRSRVIPDFIYRYL